MAAQRWMEQRLAGLTPRSFGGTVHVHCAQALAPPPGFEGAWTAAQSELLDATEAARSVEAVLCFGDFLDKNQAASIDSLLCAVDDMGPRAPPVLYIHHSGQTENMEQQEMMDQKQDHFTRLNEAAGYFLARGMDHVVLEPFEGFKLALEVRTKLASVAQKCADAEAKMNHQQALNDEAERTQAEMHSLIWGYSLRKLAPRGFPVIEDDTLGYGIPSHMPGYEVGQQLGRGAYGAVYKLVGRGNDSVVKAIDKKIVGGLQGLARFIRSIKIQRALSADWQHPNIVQLFQVYNSPTHIFCRLQYGGPMNLHRRLKQGLLPAGKTTAVLQQGMAAITHLHGGPRICHMDIKPENFIIDEGEDDMRVMLADFDLSFVYQDGARCRSRCGTLPFVAPEILLDPTYQPMPTDIWSLGVVMMEVMCGCGVLDTIISVDTHRVKQEDLEVVGGRFGREACRIFGQQAAASRTLQEHCAPGLEELQPRVGQLLDGVLVPAPHARWAAAPLADFLRQWQLQTP